MNNPKIHYPSIAKFQQFVELKDYRPPTRKEYVRYVCKCAEHFDRDPITLVQDQVRQYFLFLRQEKHYTHSPMKAAKYSLRSFFVDCHQVQGWTVFQEVQIREPFKLPVVLSREEVQRVLLAVREPRLRVCMILIYHCGLRVGEAVGIQVRDLIESRTPNPRLHVRNGKGGNYAKVVVMKRCRFTDFAGTVFLFELGSSWGKRKFGEISEKMACFGFRSDRETLYECNGSPTNGGQSPWHNSHALRIGSAFPRLHC
jgi:hypothetical protein